MREYRCQCGQLLFKGDFAGSIEIKCRRCKNIKYFERILIKEVNYDRTKKKTITEDKNNIK